MRPLSLHVHLLGSHSIKRIFHPSIMAAPNFFVFVLLNKTYRPVNEKVREANHGCPNTASEGHVKVMQKIKEVDV